MPVKTMCRIGVYFLLAYACALVAGCDAMCDNELVKSVTSPDGSKKAVAFVRGCGATTADSTQVSIVSNWRGAPSGSGNLLIVEGKPAIEMSWISDSALRIANTGPGRIFKQEDNVKGSSVRYE